MYNFAKQHKGEYQWGRFFENAPTLPLQEQGKPFRFMWSPVENSMDDMIVNMEHPLTMATISTTYDLPWSLDGFVLIDGELWKIIRMQFERLRPQANSLVKGWGKRWTISINKVDNPVGIER